MGVGISVYNKKAQILQIDQTFKNFTLIAAGRLDRLTPTPAAGVYLSTPDIPSNTPVLAFREIGYSGGRIRLAQCKLDNGIFSASFQVIGGPGPVSVEWFVFDFPDTAVTVGTGRGCQFMIKNRLHLDSSWKLMKVIGSHDDVDTPNINRMFSFSAGQVPAVVAISSAKSWQMMWDELVYYTIYYEPMFYQLSAIDIRTDWREIGVSESSSPGGLGMEKNRSNYLFVDVADYAGEYFLPS